MRGARDLRSSKAAGVADASRSETAASPFPTARSSFHRCGIAKLLLLRHPTVGMISKHAAPLPHAGHTRALDFRRNGITCRLMPLRAALRADLASVLLSDTVTARFLMGEE